MLTLGEPDRTPFDLNFPLFGFRIRIHWMFWLVTLIFGASGSATPEGVLIWVGVAFVSILVHELGHAFAFRYYGLHARVVLYGLGGLAIPESSGNPWTVKTRELTGWRKIAVSLAGPAAGLCLAGLTLLVAFAVGRPIFFEFGGPFLFLYDVSDLGEVSPYLAVLAGDLLFLNLFWSVVNLLPVFPLDGGQASRELFYLYSRGNPLAESLMLSIGTGVAIAAWGILAVKSVFIAIFFGLMAYQSYQALRQFSGGGPYGGYQ